MNKNILKRSLVFSILLVLCKSLGLAQITISSPVIREVFQRDLTNKASISIVGSYQKPIDKVEAKFTPVEEGQGTAIDWTTIKVNPVGGLYKGDIIVKGGWYKLEIRGTLNGNIVDETTLEKVGVGEVFLIAGQSNAAGVWYSKAEQNALDVNDDRINCANFYNATDMDAHTDYQVGEYFKLEPSNYEYSIIGFEKLKGTSAIGPRGKGPYYWGLLGEKLVQRLNVPVLFFNAAHSGTSIRNWVQSAKGEPTESEFVPGEFYKFGTPYSAMKSVLNYYGNNLGLRAILWHQGESDNLFKTTQQDYLKGLDYIIKKSRADFNKDIPWVVAQASLVDINERYLPVINAQNAIISSSQNTFKGPSTDFIENPRSVLAEKVHFTPTFYAEVAEAWNQSLNDDFFLRAIPVQAEVIPEVSLECFTDDKLILKLPVGYKSYDWLDDKFEKVASGDAVILSSGSYTARIKNNNDNVLQVPQFSVKANVAPAKPVVSILEGTQEFCEGTKVKLTADNGSIFNWSNGMNTKEIQVDSSQFLSLTIIDANGCLSPVSNDLKLTRKPRPKQIPFITNTVGATTFCEGQSVTLSSSSQGSEGGYIWSNGATTKDIKSTESGDFSVQVKGVNGCASVSSAIVTVKVYDVPESPVVSVAATQDTVFCEGNSVTLKIDNPTLGITWLIDSRDVASSIVAKTSGVYQAVYNQTYENGRFGCVSKPSEPIYVSVKPNPAPFQLTTLPFNIEAKSIEMPTEFIWSFNDQVLKDIKANKIKTQKEGKYSVIARNIYERVGEPLVCAIEPQSIIFTLPNSDSDLIVFPNPSLDGNFKIASKKDIEEAIMKIYSPAGFLIHKTSFPVIDEIKNLDLGGLVEGVYVMKVESKEGVIFTKNLLIKK
ncbi:MAG: T9SS type A sorting domain-containing protein [Pseudarcicella sp.]|nr:T9SS type A sorting domain-containing protein [Pseudarcicella sp.]